MRLRLNNIHDLLFFFSLFHESHATMRLLKTSINNGGPQTFTPEKLQFSRLNR